MNWEHFAGLALWNQSLLVLLGLLLIVFAGMILRQLISRSLAVLVSKPDALRSKGWWMTLGEWVYWWCVWDRLSCRSICTTRSEPPAWWSPWAHWRVGCTQCPISACG
ncbi:MAG: hypothetical protein IPH35_10465 [Rhodoferax sp.]|nr:hypothetical protein [Rhodoferax sp.]